MRAAVSQPSSTRGAIDQAHAVFLRNRMTKSSAKRRPRLTTSTPLRDTDVRRTRLIDESSSFTALKAGRLHSASVQRWILVVLTCGCLAPFLNEAFHVDDPLFLWTAKQIVKHPINPYGFSVVWYSTAMGMAQVTKNPPLASYFLAAIGSWAGWSERVLHLAFLLPLLAVMLSVHQMAKEMTRSPLLAAIITLVSPGFLLSATSVMSDVPMLALWLLAIIFWKNGIEQTRVLLLVSSAVLIGVCSLTKYFGVSLIPLLFLYSVWRDRRVRTWALYFLIPILMLGAYQWWTRSLYGEGSLSSVASYVSYARNDNSSSTMGSVLVALSFAGGCVLSALFLIPWLWSRKWIVAATAFAVLATTAIVLGWVPVENAFPDEHRVLLAAQLGLFILGGLSVIWLAFSDFWRKRDADSMLLLAWVLGTYVFAAFLNWTVNGRSILPMIPAVALLIARRFDYLKKPREAYAAIVPLAACLIISLWVTAGDAALANSARRAAADVRTRGAHGMKRILFSGHWGFQYYMDLLGGEAIDASQTVPTVLDLVVVPRNNSNPVHLKSGEPIGTVSKPIRTYATTMQPDVAAGFYSSVWGPMPYVFTRVPDDQYDLYQFSGLVGMGQSEGVPQP